VFALCGPLQLPPRQAVVADECYNGGFMVGRLLSMFVVGRVSPRRMLKWSAAACLCAAAAVALKADQSAAVLYACALVFGFAISWQFGAAYSWASERLDVAGSRGMAFHVGCTLGGSFSAFAAGRLFERSGHMSPWFMNLGLAAVQVTAYLGLATIFNEGKALEDYRPVDLEENLSNDED